MLVKCQTLVEKFAMQERGNNLDQERENREHPGKDRDHLSSLHFVDCPKTNQKNTKSITIREDRLRFE